MSRGTRTLVTGWFSFVDGEATAGDVLALRRVRAVLDTHGVPYDVAFSPRFRPGLLSLETARPQDYTRLLFVCGPLHGPLVAWLHQRFAHCRRVAVGTSLLDPADPATAGFHAVLPRDGGHGPPSLDLALRAPPTRQAPVAGVVLTEGQREYSARRRHETVTRHVRAWLAGTDCAPLPLETRLDEEDGLLCATGGQFLSLLARTDVVVTDRLHGLVLALRVGVPALAVDPVHGGAKVTAQARACRWPALIPAEEVDGDRLDAWWGWCLTRGRDAAARRRRVLARTGDTADALEGALLPGPEATAGSSH